MTLGYAQLSYLYSNFFYQLVSLCILFQMYVKHHKYFMHNNEILYNLESKTPVLLSKQGFGMGSYFRRGLTLEQPNDKVLHTLRKYSVLE